MECAGAGSLLFSPAVPENTDCHYANVMNILLGETLHFLTALQQIRDHGKTLLELKKEQHPDASPDGAPSSSPRSPEQLPCGKR